MHILLSNDDGIFAEGIETLAHALQPLGTLTIVAPSSERSAASHSLTIEHPLRAKPVQFPVKVAAAYSVTGTPSDCVKLAVSQLMPKLPDLVVSGINCGANLSVDVFYSGTVAAAFEGVFNNIPSVAFSLYTRDSNIDFSQTREWVHAFIKWTIANPPPLGVMYNVNIPPLESLQIKGWKLTRLGKVYYRDSYERRHDPNGNPYFWLTGEPEVLDHSEETDVIALHDGYISVTPIRAELTDFSLLEKMKQNFHIKLPGK